MEHEDSVDSTCNLKVESVTPYGLSESSSATLVFSIVSYNNNLGQLQNLHFILCFPPLREVVFTGSVQWQGGRTRSRAPQLSLNQQLFHCAMSIEN